MSELNALWRVWTDHPVIKIPKTEYTLRGFSIASLRSNFYIQELGVMLDAGISGNMAPDHVFISHQHADHVGSLPFHLITKAGRKVQVYTPAESRERIENYIESLFTANGDTYGPGEERRYQMVPVEPGVLDLTIKNKRFDVEVIRCYHAVPCVGYGFTERRRKLRAQYLGLKGADIKKLQSEGVEIYDEVRYPFFCYVGDTDRRIFDEKALDKYTTIMIECTFLLPDDLDQADRRTHLHFDYLRPYIEARPQTTFILYHFSQRYKKSEVEAFFAERNLPNVIAWAN